MADESVSLPSPVAFSAGNGVWMAVGSNDIAVSPRVWLNLGKLLSAGAPAELKIAEMKLGIGSSEI